MDSNLAFSNKKMLGRECTSAEKGKACQTKDGGDVSTAASVRPADVDGHPHGEEGPPPAAPSCQYEYLDHTADVQLHAWGESLAEALEQLVISLYGYMTTEIDRVDPVYTMDFSASGHDLSALVYNLLDNCLYNFAAEPFFIGRTAKLLDLSRPARNTPSGEELSVHLRVWGESFDPQKHPPGTEIKAITYSNMQIVRKKEEERDNDEFGPGRTDIFVIVDI